MRAILKRFPNAINETLGVITLYNNNNVHVQQFTTLELPWRDNKVGLSCIPAGIYKVRPYVSVNFGKCFHVLNVKNRDAILIHAGNFNTNTRGCILLGLYFENINNDKLIDVGNSRLAMDILNEYCINEFELLIQ